MTWNGKSSAYRTRTHNIERERPSVEIYAAEYIDIWIISLTQLLLAQVTIFREVNFS